jgi:hypothetical protein
MSDPETRAFWQELREADMEHRGEEETRQISEPVYLRDVGRAYEKGCADERERQRALRSIHRGFCLFIGIVVGLVIAALLEWLKK